MSKLQYHQGLCSCGSGKPYQECCGLASGAQIMHFARAKKNKYGLHCANALNDLLTYSKRYYYNWESPGLAKFLSYSHISELDDNLSPVFWHWYIINFKSHKDVSPLIDFYLAEHGESIDPQLLPMLQALQNSYLSLYQVQWIRNNVVLLRDIFVKKEYVLERDFGSSTNLIEKGSLLLARIVVIDNNPVIVGKSILILPEHKTYLWEEIDSLRIYEGIDDIEVFLKNHGEALCGLVVDLTHGVKKARIKSRTLMLGSLTYGDLLLEISNNKDFSLLETNKLWLKFIWGSDSLTRIYVLADRFIIAAEDNNDLAYLTQRLTQMIRDLGDNTGYQWTEGCNIINEEVSEEIFLEFMHDKYIEEWLTAPLEELDGMTPTEATQSIRGRVLLDILLNELEFMELRAKSRGEYYLSPTEIKAKLKLDVNKLHNSFLQPEAVAIKTEKNRLHQPLSCYITAYNWVDEEAKQVAVTLCDYVSADEYPRSVAWMLYIWHEFTTIYRPKISKVKDWLAAIEYTYSDCRNEKANYGRIAEKYQISIGVINRHAQLMLRHFKQHPLDFNINLVVYPKWHEIDDSKKILCYEEVLQYLQVFEYSIRHIWAKSEEQSRQDYYAMANFERQFWDDDVKTNLEEFYKDHYLFDYVNDNNATIIGEFWKNQACRFPPALKQAAYNLMISSVGAYRIYPLGNTGLILEDIFTGNRYEAYGYFGNKVQEDVVPGMIGISRIVMLEEKCWAHEPMFIVLPELEELLNKNFDTLLRQFEFSAGKDSYYYKQRGELLVKAYILSLDELEQNTMELMRQPLNIDWQIADIVNAEQAFNILGDNRKFKHLSTSGGYHTFLWSGGSGNKNYQWGIIILGMDNLLVFTPPGKDITKFLKDIRINFKVKDMMISFRRFQPELSFKRLLDDRIVEDLTGFFSQNPNLSLRMLRPDDLEDEELEWEQGIFLLKIGTMMMKYMDDK